jgi:signal peptidase I
MTEDAQESTPPKKGLALALGLLGPPGIGQFYLGRRRRAVLWFAVPAVVNCALIALMPATGAAIGYGRALVLLVVVAIGAWLASLVDASRVQAHPKRPSTGMVAAYWVVGVLLALGLRSSIRHFLLEAFKIPAGSMTPALMVGDHIMTDKLVYLSRAPKRGEVIVFKYPEHPEQDFVKRVIAIPGDRLEVRHGHPVINGWEVPHCSVGKAEYEAVGDRHSGTLELEFLDGEAYPIFLDEMGDLLGYQGPFTAKPGELWVLGDNRHNSHDSRMWFGGTGAGVPYANVRGRALFRWLSVGDDGVDWSRAGTSVAEPLLPSSMASLNDAMRKCLAERPPRDKTLPP